MYKSIVQFPSKNSGSPVEDAIQVHLPELYRAALALCRNRLVAEDLVHDSCVKILTAQKKSKQAKLQNDRAWFHKVLLNTFRDYYRRELRSPITDCPEQFSNVIEFQPAAESMPEDRLAQKQFEKSAQLAISNLPVEIRDVVVLKLVSDFSYKEIANILTVPVGTVMSRLSRGRGALRQELEHHFSGGHENTAGKRQQRRQIE